MTEPDDLADELAALKETLSADEVSEIVRWQMTGILQRKTPVMWGGPSSQPKCPKCKRDWHGLKKDGCEGSFDTPV
jgi:hypothetical protein